MSWIKKAINTSSRMKRNIVRYNDLRNKLERLSELATFTQSNTKKALERLLEDKLVKANPPLEKGIKFLLKGENNQSVVHDNPKRASEIMDNMIAFIDDKIRHQKDELNAPRKKKRI